MLILTRKPGEAIYVGEDIVVVYVGQNSNGSARIGIVAPPEVKILRDNAKEREPRQ